eukprot:8512927-Alexandrium_andersonii.AAC.1
MAAPTTTGWAALARLTRYPIVRPRCIYHLPWQDDGAPLCAYADTDFAGCLRARRSTCGGVCARGLHAVKHWSTTQKT